MESGLGTYCLGCWGYSRTYDWEWAIWHCNSVKRHDVPKTRLRKRLGTVLDVKPNVFWSESGGAATWVFLSMERNFPVQYVFIANAQNCCPQVGLECGFVSIFPIGIPILRHPRIRSWFRMNYEFRQDFIIQHLINPNLGLLKWWIVPYMMAVWKRWIWWSTTGLNGVPYLDS